jgi:hypothetical protein
MPKGGGMEDVARAALRDLRKRMTRVCPDEVRACLEVLTDTEAWSRPNSSSNSVGNLVVHLCGSTRHFIGMAIGGTGYRRNRPTEFAEKGPVPRDILLRALDETVWETDRVLESLTPERLLDRTDALPERFTFLELILRISHHWALHTGQIIWATKAVKGPAFAEHLKETRG